MEEKAYTQAEYSQSVLEMIRVAHEYCVLLEKFEEKSIEEFFDYQHKLLPLIYLKGNLLPEVHVENTEANERFVTEEEYQNYFNELRNRFGIRDEFWYSDIDYPEDELRKGSFAECFMDIYQDMKDFLLLYQKNSRDAKQNAVYECRELFKSHWGPRILYLIRALHPILFPSIDQSMDYPDIY